MSKLIFKKLLNLTWNSLLIFKNAGGIVKKVRIR